MSTQYQSIPLPRAKAVLRVLDHSAVFLLIAGTYTPFTLVNLRGPWGWALFGVIWSLAIVGIALQGILIRQKTWVTTLPYLAMGWVALVGLKPLFESVAPGGLVLLFTGGLAYTVGSVFYVWRRLPYHHAIWHGFVLAGSVCHFFAILFYVIPLPISQTLNTRVHGQRGVSATLSGFTPNCGFGIWWFSLPHLAPAGNAAHCEDQLDDPSVGRQHRHRRSDRVFVELARRAAYILHSLRPPSCAPINRSPVINSVAPIRVCDNGGWTDTWFAGHGRIFNIGV